ncbi:MAG: transporter [Acidobacteriota bacterium]
MATGNANPLDPSHLVSPATDYETKIVLLGYHRMIDLLGRSATASFLIPVGNLKRQVAGLPESQSIRAKGFGDLMVQLDLNLFGAPAMKGLAQVARYEPKLTVDLLATFALPIGEYDEKSSLNLGQNRWYGRIGAPIMYTIGPWVPDKRTTIEVLPAVWFFGENDEFRGVTLKNDPLLQLEGHLTRDFTRTFWASFDVAWFYGGTPEIGFVEGKKLRVPTAGLTVGFQVNENLTFNASYSSTFDDSAPDDLKSDEIKLKLTYAWHPLVEAIKGMREH